MEFIWHGFQQAWDLLLHPTADFKSILQVTLEVTVWSALIGLLIGVPIGLAVGIGRFRGRQGLLALANSGFGIPPVVVGVFLVLILLRAGPLGPLGLAYTVKGMVVAQSVLDIPIVIALTASAARSVDPGLLAQARALGASRWRVGWFTAREARNGIVVAAIAAVGAGLSEVAAVVLVGGNIIGQTRTMAGAMLTSVSAGDYAEAIALGVLLLGLVILLGAALTFLQLRDAPARSRGRNP
jgi:tungstate transport system permease protein